MGSDGIELLPVRSHAATPPHPLSSPILPISFPIPNNTPLRLPPPHTHTQPRAHTATRAHRHTQLSLTTGLPAVPKAIAALDTDGDGKLSRDEVAQGAHQPAPPNSGFLASLYSSLFGGSPSPSPVVVATKIP